MTTAPLSGITLRAESAVNAEAFRALIKEITAIELSRDADDVIAIAGELYRAAFQFEDRDRDTIIGVETWRAMHEFCRAAKDRANKLIDFINFVVRYESCVFPYLYEGKERTILIELTAGPVPVKTFGPIGELVVGSMIQRGIARATCDDDDVMISLTRLGYIVAAVILRRNSEPQPL
jgi:hypothetical protein